MADRDRQAAVGVLVDEQLTGLHVGERAGVARPVGATVTELEFDRTPELQPQAGDVVVVDVERDVAVRVDMQRVGHQAAVLDPRSW